MTTWYEQYLAAWDSLDIEQVLAWIGDDPYYEDTTIGHSAKGTKQVRNFIAASFENVPDARFEFVNGVDDGESYAIEWVMHPMGVRGVSFGKLVDGKIVENRDYWNGKLFDVPNT